MASHGNTMLVSNRHLRRRKRFDAPLRGGSWELEIQGDSTLSKLMISLSIAKLVSVIPWGYAV